MASVWATARCVHCGAPSAVLVPPTPGARWVTCPYCHGTMPVVPPTNPPPIFSWEVYPTVYPPPPPLRGTGRPAGRLAAIALVASTLLLVGVAGALVASGAEALGPATFRLSGVVELASDGSRYAGALVTLASETGWTDSLTTSPNGTFTFTGVPGGGATLNVSAPGMASVSRAMFFSPSFRSTGAGPAGVLVLLSPGSAGPASTVYESPYPDLESFVSSVWSAAALLGLGAIVSAIGAHWAYRRARPTVGVAGGLSAAVAPFALAILGVTSAFPLAVYPAAAIVGLGLAAAILEMLPLVQLGRAADLGDG